MRYSTAVLSVLLLGAFCLPAPAQTDLTGHWEGALELPQRTMNITVDLKKNDAGDWTGSFGFPAAEAEGLKLSEIKVDGKSLSFKVPEAPSGPVFELALAEDGHLLGAMKVQDQSFTAKSKRTGEAKVVLAPPSPAVSSDFEGTWEGNLDAPNRQLRFVLHFVNQPDGTVQASSDSPDQGATGIGVSHVVQKDNALEFRIMTVGASFKGALDKESGVLKGELTQRGFAMALQMKRAQAK